MDKNTMAIVASNLTVAYITSSSKKQQNQITGSPAFISGGHSKTSIIEIYQKFLDLLKEQQQKD